MWTRTGHGGTGARRSDRLRTGEARWSYRGRPVRVAVTDRAALPAARRLVARELSALRRASDPYRGELGRVHRAAGRPVPVGALLAELVRVALATAEATDGTVDPTVGVALLRHRRPDRWQPVCGSASGSSARDGSSAPGGGSARDGTSAPGGGDPPP
ncbi:FAD:protein FMN transferase, partial [Micromonospora echinofusca]